MKNKIFRFFVNWMPMILYCVAIYALSSSPIHPPRIRYADKVIHFFVFALLGAMGLRGLYKFTPLGTGSSMGLAFAGGCFLGLLDEFHQFFVPGRNADLMDLFSDALGSFFGVFFYAVFVSPAGKDSDNA